jgi:hypothetical protein
MALFTDLRYFQFRLTDPQSGADWQDCEVDSGGGDILGEIAEGEFHTFPAHQIDILGSEKRDLAMPRSGMGVTCYTPVIPQLN